MWILGSETRGPYPCGSATSSARDVKQGCRLCTHAFQIMHRRKRSWMTKGKSRGPEIDRQQPTNRQIKNGRIRILLGTRRSLKKRKKRKKCISIVELFIICLIILAQLTQLFYSQSPKLEQKQQQTPLFSNKQKLICFRTIEWVGKAQ